MLSFKNNTYRVFKTFLAALLLCFGASSAVQESFVVAIVVDGPSERLAAPQ